MNFTKILFCPILANGFMTKMNMDQVSVIGFCKVKMWHTLFILIYLTEVLQCTINNGVVTALPCWPILTGHLSGVKWPS